MCAGGCDRLHRDKIVSDQLNSGTSLEVTPANLSQRQRKAACYGTHCVARDSKKAGFNRVPVCDYGCMSMSLRVYVCLLACMRVCMYVCLLVCVSVCMHVRLCVCMLYTEDSEGVTYATSNKCALTFLAGWIAGWLQCLSSVRLSRIHRLLFVALSPLSAVAHSITSTYLPLVHVPLFVLSRCFLA
jgi:hypothetical protein